MSENKFEIGKTYKTEGGDDIRIIADDLVHSFMKYVGLVALSDGDEQPITLTADGKYYEDGRDVTFNIAVPKRTVWINLYAHKDEAGYTDGWHETQEEAVRLADLDDKDFITTVSVEIPA